MYTRLYLPWLTEVRCDVLRSIGVLLRRRFNDTGSFGGDLCGTTVVLLEAAEQLVSERRVSFGHSLRQGVSVSLLDATYDSGSCILHSLHDCLWSVVVL